MSQSVTKISTTWFPDVYILGCPTSESWVHYVVTNIWMHSIGSILLGRGLSLRLADIGNMFSLTQRTLHLQFGFHHVVIHPAPGFVIDYYGWYIPQSNIFIMYEMEYQHICMRMYFNNYMFMNEYSRKWILITVYQWGFINEVGFCTE